MSKYGNKKTELDGIVFDSKAEAKRYSQLRMLERAGQISDLQRQVKFELVRGVRLYGRSRPAIKYIADFVYNQGGHQVVEDVKGMLTPVYRLKRHLMMAMHGIEIREVA